VVVCDLRQNDMLVRPKRTAWSKLGRVLRFAAGVTAILAGILGLVLPIVPGWVLIFLGVAVLAPNARVIRWLRRHVANR
jgi:hypothetical protein